MINCGFSFTAYSGLSSAADLNIFSSASWTSGLKVSEVVIAITPGSTTSYVVNLDQISLSLLNPTGESSCALSSLVASSSSGVVNLAVDGQSLTADTSFPTTSAERLSKSWGNFQF